jgi:hypothetical protein
VALAAGLIKSKLIDAAAKNYQVQASLPDQNPADYFRSQKALREAEWRDFSAMVAEWNVASDWRRELVPVAHAFFMQNYGWFRRRKWRQPGEHDEDCSHLELALWFRWARGRIETTGSRSRRIPREMTVSRDELRREAQRASSTPPIRGCGGLSTGIHPTVALDMDAFSSMKMSVYTFGPTAANVSLSICSV